MREYLQLIMQDIKKKSDQERLHDLYKLLIAVLVLWLISIFAIPYLYPKLSNRALFGDSFGVINSLFSGFAFAGIIYTILLQRKELSLQRNELALTRIEFKQQNKTLSAQKFENSFFNLLNFHYRIVETIDSDFYYLIFDKKNVEYYEITKGNKKETSQFSRITLTGRDVFKARFQILKRELTNMDHGIDIKRNFHQVYRGEMVSDFSHYINNLLRLLVFVDSSNSLSNDDKILYSQLIKDQFSEFELVWIFFYIIFGERKILELKELFEKYGFFENLPLDGDYILHDSLLTKLNKSAFLSMNKKFDTKIRQSYIERSRKKFNKVARKKELDLANSIAKEISTLITLKYYKRFNARTRKELLIKIIITLQSYSFHKIIDSYWVRKFEFLVDKDDLVLEYDIKGNFKSFTNIITVNLLGDQLKKFINVVSSS